MPILENFVAAPSLDGPGGPVELGDPSSPDRVTGPLLDFCLVVTQRRLPTDTALVATGPLALIGTIPDAPR